MVGEGAYGEQWHHSDQHQRWSRQEEAHERLVVPVEPVARAAPFLLVGVLLGQQAVSEERHCQPGDEERDHKPRRHGERERPEEGTGNAAQESEWHENYDGGGAGTRERMDELDCCCHYLAVVGVWTAAQATHDVLGHDNRIVDDESHRRRHPTERHHVEAHLEGIKQHDGGGKHRGHHNDRDQRDLQVAKKREQN